MSENRNRKSLDNENRGLASADEETRERVAREGGEASHDGRGGSSSRGSSENRGFATISEEERKRIASKGGQSRNRDKTSKQDVPFPRSRRRQ